MNRTNKAYVILLGMTLLAIGCTKDEGPVLIPKPVDPGVPIDTAYFATEVVPIFQQHCWVCHPDMAGLDLSATGAYANLVGITSTNHAPAIRIVAGDPDASVLWHKVSGSPDFGINMPPNGTFLTNDELQLIRDWIEQGALDN